MSTLRPFDNRGRIAPRYEVAPIPESATGPTNTLTHYAGVIALLAYTAALIVWG